MLEVDEWSPHGLEWSGQGRFKGSVQCHEIHSGIYLCDDMTIRTITTRYAC